MFSLNFSFDYYIVICLVITCTFLLQVYAFWKLLVFFERMVKYENKFHGRFLWQGGIMNNIGYSVYLKIDGLFIFLTASIQTGLAHIGRFVEHLHGF